jgi:ribosome recycling factor
LTADRRKELVKHLQGMTEEHRVAIRNIRRDANDHLKKLLKDKTISEDEERMALAEVEKLTKSEMDKLEAAAKAKEKEISEFK